jgi:hypothetical protein
VTAPGVTAAPSAAGSAAGSAAAGARAGTRSPTAGPPAPGGGSTFRRSGPRPAAARRALRAAAVFAVLVVAYALLAAVLGGPATSRQYLESSSPAPGGTRALAEILRQRGVTVRAGDDVATTVDERRTDQTVLVVEPGRLGQPDLDRLGRIVDRGGDVVLVAPGSGVLDALHLPVAVSDSGGLPTTQTPGCGLPEARTAGSARLGDGPLFVAIDESQSTPGRAATLSLCYPVAPDHASLAVIEARGSGGRFVLLSSGSFLTNDRLDDGGDAALALGLLARHADLTWVIQRQTSAQPVDGTDAVHVLGRTFWLTCLQVLLALVVLALWRGRRLGPPVAEPLPVVVRAAETTEGRGRLYAAARARELAADALRAGLRARLADRLGLPVFGGTTNADRLVAAAGAAGAAPGRGGAPGTSGPDPTALVASVAEQTGRSPVEIGALLYGSGVALSTPSATSWPAVGWPAVGWPPAGGPAAGGPGGSTPEAGRQAPDLDDAALLWLAAALDDLDRQVGGR